MSVTVGKNDTNYTLNEILIASLLQSNSIIHPYSLCRLNATPPKISFVITVFAFCWALGASVPLRTLAYLTYLTYLTYRTRTLLLSLHCCQTVV